MNNTELQQSLDQYNSQLAQINEALNSATSEAEKESLLSLQADLRQLVELTQESLDTLTGAETTSQVPSEPLASNTDKCKDSIDEEYALFMAEMASTGAYDKDDGNENEQEKKDADSDIEDELSSMLGMKCAVYHTHKWGGQPSLHNAMVSALEPRADKDKFKDLQVRVLFTHPTHAEMLPCPFFLDGECRFDDEQCRYSHGEVVSLSKLQEATEPDFKSLKIGSRVLVKLKPVDAESTSLTKKAAEKYHLWHRGLVKSIDYDKKTCTLRLEHGLKTGEKRKSDPDEFESAFEEIFPLNDTAMENSESDDSLSDTEYPDMKSQKMEELTRKLIVEKSLQNNGPALGEWEKHTRGIGSKLMFAMGYVAGTGLGSTAEGRIEPVPARVLPVGKSLDHCMDITEKAAGQDPLKVEQRLKRLQKKEEERNRRAYEREKEKERRNVFNFLNRTLGDKADEQPGTANNGSLTSNLKKSTGKDLNIEQFKITEEVRKVERDVFKLKNSLYRHAQGSNIHKNIQIQLSERTKDLDRLKNREQEIVKEQKNRKDKQKLTLF